MRIGAIGLCDPGYAEDRAALRHRQVVGAFGAACEVFDVGLQADEAKSPPAVGRLAVEHARDPFDALLLVQPSWARPDVLLQVIRSFPRLPMLLAAPGSPVADGVVQSTAPLAGVGSTLPILRRQGVPCELVWSSPGREIDVAAAMPFLRAARAARLLRGSKLGMVGFGDMRLHATAFDVQALHAAFGVEVESVDMLQVQQAMEAAPADQLAARRKELTAGWTYHGQAPDTGAMDRAVAMFLALDRLAADRGWSGLSIKCPTGVAAAMGMTPCLAGCLLARRLHYVCENDIPGLLTQVILGHLSGQASAYWELYEALDEALLLGCCGFSAEAILDGPLKVRKFSEFFAGLGCCSRVRGGPYTLARLGSGPGGRFVLNCLTGQATPPPAWAEVALGLPQHPSVSFKPDGRSLAQVFDSLLAQHFAVTAGTWDRELACFARIAGMELI
jgi:L-fucose isomerase-like protein